MNNPNKVDNKTKTVRGASITSARPLNIRDNRLFDSDGSFVLQTYLKQFSSDMG